MDVLDLRYGDLAIALYASPVATRRMPEADLADSVEKGLAALGGRARVTQLHAEWLELNHRFLRRRITEEAYNEAIDAWLSSMTGPPADRDRLDWCIGQDYVRLLP